MVDGVGRKSSYVEHLPKSSCAYIYYLFCKRIAKYSEKTIDIKQELYSELNYDLNLNYVIAVPLHNLG